MFTVKENNLVVKKSSESMVAHSFNKILFIYVFIIYSSCFSKFGTYNIGLLDTFEKYGRYTIYLLTFVAFVTIANGLVKYKGLNQWIIFLWFIFIISIIVSTNPFGTIFLISNLLIIIFWAYWSTIKFTLKEFYELLTTACLFIVILQVYFMIVYPQYAYSTYLQESIFSGTFYQKNNTAIFMAFSVIVALCNFLYNKNKIVRLQCIFVGLIAIYCMVEVKSVTSLVSCTIACLLTILFSQRRHIINFILLGLAINSTFIYMLLNKNGLLGSILVDLGRDSSLTGRSSMWESLFLLIEKKPLFGYGYDTFWIYNLDLRRYVVNNAGGAHNGIIELLLGIGIVGTIWFFVLWIKYGHQLSNILVKGNRGMQFQYAYMILLLFYIISERTFGSSSYQTLIFAWCIISTVDKTKVKSKELSI